MQYAIYTAGLDTVSTPYSLRGRRVLGIVRAFGCHCVCCAILSFRELRPASEREALRRGVMQRPIRRCIARGLGSLPARVGRGTNCAFPPICAEVFPRQRQQRIWGPLFGLVSLRDSAARGACCHCIARPQTSPVLEKGLWPRESLSLCVPRHPTVSDRGEAAAQGGPRKWIPGRPQQLIALMQRYATRVVYAECRVVTTA